MTPHDASDAIDATDAADTIDVRPITASDLPDWLRAVKTGFLQEPVVSDEDVENRRSAFILGRTLGAFDGSRCVATFRSFPQELTAVGGAAVPADAISAVTVSPTHRRRGLLTRMMKADLAAARSGAMSSRRSSPPSTRSTAATASAPRPPPPSGPSTYRAQVSTPAGRVRPTAAVSTSWTPRTSARRDPSCTNGSGATGRA